MSGQQTSWIFDFMDKLSGPMKQMVGNLNSGFSKMKKEQDAFRKNNNKVGESMNNLNDPIGKLKKQLGGLFVADKVKDFLGEVIHTTGEFQKYEAVLTNTFGSKSAAKMAMNQIVEFASKTPFAVNELTESFVKLANRGFRPSMKEMTQLGDLASSVGKPFDQLTEAILDAQTGEFERMKEFGVKAHVNGDKIKFTFKGVTTEVKNSEQAIRNYVLGLGNMQGVTGGMAAISKTIPGQLSNLGDNFDAFKLKMGTMLAPMVEPIIGFLSGMIDKGKTVLNWIGSNAGLLKDFFKSIAIGAGAAAIAYGIFNFQTILLTMSTIALNLAFLANPLTWIIGLIGGVVAAVVMMWQRFEWFRGGIMGIWETIKVFLTKMKDGFFSVFGGIGKLLKGVFTLNMDDIKDGIKQLATGLLDANPLTSIVKNSKELGKGFKKGYEEGAAEVRNKKAQEAQDNEDRKAADLGLTPGQYAGYKAAAQKKGVSVEDLVKQQSGKSGYDKKMPMSGSGSGSSSKGGAGGGGSIRNNNIRIESLVKNIIINSSVKESVANIKDEVQKALVAVVRDTEVAISAS